MNTEEEVTENAGGIVAPGTATIGVADLARVLGENQKFLWLLHYHSDDLYHTLHLRKQNGKIRVVHNPQPRLKAVQKKIINRILANVEQKNCVGAYVRGKSCRDTAVQHAGRKVIVSLDIQDFFPSITTFAVQAMLRRKLRCTSPAAQLLAGLVTKDGSVPQGAPTSGDICNLVAAELDTRIQAFITQRIGKYHIVPLMDAPPIDAPPGQFAGWVHSQDLTSSYWGGVRLVEKDNMQYMHYRFPSDTNFVYTRYSDDIDISCNVSLPRPVVDWMIHHIVSLLEGQGYRANHAKTKVERSGKRQTVLGMTVNAHPNVPRTKYLKYRALVHNCSLNGFDAEATRAGYPSGIALYTHVLGVLNYMGQVNPAKKAKLIGKLHEAALSYAEQLLQK